MADERATDDERTLLDAVQSYFDALYNGDTELFATVMHPNIRLYCPTPEPPLEMDLDAYLALVRGRPSPADRKDPRHDRVLAIEIASPTTAHVRVQDAYLPRLFTDELTFVRPAGGEWRIISKVWHFEVMDKATAT